MDNDLKGWRISELIEAMKAILETQGDLLCQVHDGRDPSEFADVTRLRVEMGIGEQVVKIDA